MAKLNIKKNDFKPNMKGNRIKGYIAKNDEKIKLLEDKLKEQDELLKKLLSKQTKEEEDDE